MMGSLQRWFIFSKSTLLNMWWPAIQWNHETLKLLHHIKTKHLALKHKTLEFFKRKKCEHEDLKQLLKATTSSNVSALRASFLVANCIAKTKKLFTVGEELILPAAMDICRELLRETAVLKVACVPLWASSLTRRLDEITEDIQAQLLGLVSHHGMQSSWRVHQCWQQGNDSCFCAMFLGGYAGGYVMCILVANQHCSHRATQVFDYI